MKFNPRLSCPSRDNKYYNSNINPFVSAGYGMFQNNGNCTCYAYGRFMEEAGWNSCNLSTGNAENFYPKNDGYPRGQTPKLGAIICWEGVGSKAGHVAVVEQINADGSILTSNSAWQGGLFYLKTLYPPYYYMGDLYEFQGFIYNPDIDDTPTPTPISGSVSRYQQWLNDTYGYNLVVDDIFGSDTKKHAVMALQTEFNDQLGAGLVVDGIFGQNTYYACPNLTIGMSGNITKNVQYMLEIKGFNIGSYGCDGIYGQDTANCVGDYQSCVGLYCDKICGANTFRSLYS